MPRLFTRVLTVSMALISLFVLTTLLSTSVQAANPIWAYTEWDMECKQTQCGYGLLDRESSCRYADTGDEQPGTVCQTLYGPAVDTMECVYSEPNPEIVCGGKHGRKAYDCIYNPNFDPENLEDKYMTCKCKPNWKGTYCEIPPPPVPDPDPTDDDDDDADKKKPSMLQKILFFVIVLLVLAGIGVGIFFLVTKLRKRRSQKVTDAELSTGSLNSEPYEPVYS